ncbi:exodeoxyribonuclease V subunit gamma [Desulfomarina sp.]
MFYLHTSNRTENLLYHLGAVIKADDQRTVFDREIFLIQSQGMERMICQFLADTFRVFCNFQFLFPLHFLETIACQLGLQTDFDGYDRQVFAWRIEAGLREPDHDVFRELKIFLSGPQVDLKRYQLARRLANIFDQYQIMRPGMLESWAAGKTVTGNKSEKWQMQLWRKLQENQDAGEHRGVLFKRVTDALRQNQFTEDALPRRISVFGLNTMPPVFLDFLNCLAGHSDVHLFILSPCRHYWGDAAGRRAELSRELRRPVGNVAAIESEKDHPLLVSLGQQGRDFQQMMVESVDFRLEFDSYEDPLETVERKTLLARVQSDLLQGSIGPVKEKESPDDDSITVVSCHSAYRETAVLKDYILHRLHTDHSLELRDIIVMAPDIEQYAPFIPAVFEDIQHSIADFSLQRKNRYIRAFTDFLKLFRSSFGWVEVLDLLRQPVVFPAFGLVTADLEYLEHWVINGGVRRGLAKKGEAGEKVSWKAGLERFLMGYCASSEWFVDGVLSFDDIEGSSGTVLGGLCEFIDIIEESAVYFRQEHTLFRWSEILTGIADRLFDGGDQRDCLELHGLLTDLGATHGRYHNRPISGDVIAEWFSGVVRENRSSSGFLRGQLTFCSMLPMRSVPFRVICLLGLNEGDFPRMDHQPAFDLMADRFTVGDRSVRVDDRYQFLEAILAARSHLYLSYVGQSIRTNERIQPSVVVSELMELLESHYETGNMVTEHPLHPFSSRYFKKDGETRKLFSYDFHSFNIASNLISTVDPLKNWWRGTLDEEITRMEFSEVLSFYRNPQAWFLRNKLGLRLDKSEKKFPEEHELFRPEGLDKYHVEQQLVEHLLSGSDGREFEERLKVEGVWPLGEPGAVQYRQKIIKIQQFVEQLSSFEMGKPLAGEMFRLQVGSYIFTGTFTNLHEKGVLLFRYAKLKGKDLMAAWLHHVVAQQLFGRTTTVLVASDQVCRYLPDCAGPSLEYLLDVFAGGSCRPSRFFIEPSFVYCGQAEKTGRVKISPLEKARQTMRAILDKGYEPAWEKLFGDEGELMLDGEFEKYCREIMAPVMREGTDG